MAEGLSIITGAFNFGGGGAIGIAVGAFVALLLTAVFAVAAYFGFMWYLDKKRFTMPVDIVYVPENGSPRKKYDMGGVYTEKRSGLKRFWLRKNRVGLNPDKIPSMIDSKGREVVTLFQVGLKNFRFVDVSAHSNPGLSYTVGEEDVNWATTAFHIWKSKFEYKNWFEQYGYMVLWAVTIVGTLLLMYFVMQKADVLTAVANAGVQAAEALKEAAGQLNIASGKVIE